MKRYLRCPKTSFLINMLPPQIAKLGLIPLLLSLLHCGGGGVVPPQPLPNLTWVEPTSYMPAPTATVGLAFGVNDSVDQLVSGALPIVMTKTITNNGSAAVAAGYDITETVQRMTLVAVAGQAGFVPATGPTSTLFSCSQLGPALAPGQSATVTFALGGPGCPMNPLVSSAVLSCGLFQDTLSIDLPQDIDESSEQDNISDSYFYIPSTVQAINVNTTRNPNAAPNAVVVGQTVRVIGFQQPQTVTTHNFATSIVGPPGVTYSLNGRSPVTSNASGTSCSLAPTMPVASTAGPLAVNYTCTIPDPSYLGSMCNSFLGNVQVFEEQLNSKLTAISFDGCVIRQKSALVNVVFECNP